MVFLAFIEIVEDGKVEVLSLDGDKTPLIEQEIKKTNFTNLRLPSIKGKYKLEINIDGQHITKSININ